MPEDKPANEWTPRDHYVKATQLLIEFEDMKDDDEHEHIYFQIQSRISMHTKLAAIPASNVLDRNDEDEDYRP